MFKAKGRGQYWTGSSWKYFTEGGTTKNRLHVGNMAVSVKCPSSGSYVAPKSPIVGRNPLIGTKGYFVASYGVAGKKQGNYWGIADIHGHVSRYVRFRIWGERNVGYYDAPDSSVYGYATIPE